MPGSGEPLSGKLGDARLRALPKAHLHLHLEHSIRPATLAELAARNGVTLEGFYTFTNLAEFLGRGSVLRACITLPDDLRRICWELVEDAILFFFLMHLWLKSQPQVF